MNTQKGQTTEPLYTQLLAAVRVVYFDLVGTLIRPRESIGMQYAAQARRHGAERADPDRLGAAFSAAMRRSPPMVISAGSVSAVAAEERRWWRGLVLGVVESGGLSDVLDGARFESFFEDLYEHFTTRDAWDAYPDAAPALARLHASGLGVGLITNYDTRVYRVLDAVGLSEWLDSITIPADAGVAKPSPGIFSRALSAHGVTAAEAAYIGDSPGDDYAGSVAAGMTAILLDRHDRHGGEGFRRILSLNDLP